MTKFKRILAFLLTLVMITLAVAPLSACANPDDDECTSHVDNDGDGKCDNEGCDAPVESNKCTSHVDANGDGWCDNEGCGQPVSSDTKVSYTVQVKTVGGYLPEGLEMDLIDSANGELAAYARTDARGIVTFKNVTPKDSYVVSFSEIVDTNKTKVNTFLKGYKYEESYPVTAAGTVITLVSQLQSGGHSGVSYELGDIMHDFTMVDTDGNSHKLSELLKTKKAVVLNFWYVDCSWCVEEFPDILTAYETVYDEQNGKAYKDDIEILAIDPAANDTIASIRSFKSSLSLTFPMGKDPDGIATAFGVTAYPTTVIIDRYGMVSVKHEGALLGASYWKKLFSYYSSDDYVQRTADTFAELIPQDVPDVEQPSSDVIADYFNGDSDLKVTYHPETKPGDAEYSWPFITTTYVDGDGNEIKCIIPSNTGKDNSYATIYAEIELEAGEALMFDFHSSTEYTDTNADVLYILVDGKDMYSIAGVEKTDVWKTCCAFVANKSGTYEVAFTYLKDTADDDLKGVEDLVYLTNLRTVDESEIDVETYIFRYADELDEDDLVLNDNDGYYHVGDANGPILLANLLGYTKFDSHKIVSERLYETYIFEVNGVDKFTHFELYANYSSNSSIYGYVSVTDELKTYLDVYVKEHAVDVGKQYTSDLWLSLCSYYDAYGTNGEQLEDPIKGLASFSAYDTVLTTDENDPQYNEVKFERAVMPRGYLYKFVPTTSGVYRIVTQSASEVNAWVFLGNHDSWAEAGGNRILYVDSEQGERINPDLTIDPDGDGVYERDTTNASMIAYFEAGVEYYLSFAFYDVYEFSKFTFTVRYTHESFNAFFQASPGPFTFEENLDGSVGKTIAGGIEVALASDGYYYHHVVSKKTENAPVDIVSGDPYYGRADGIYHEYEYEDLNKTWVTKRTTVVVSGGKKTVTVEEYARGSKLYADFILPTNIFMTRTMKQLVDNYAFDFTKTATDLEGLATYISYARYGFEMKWLEEKFEAAGGGTDDELQTFINEMTYNEMGLLTIFEAKWADSKRDAALKAEGKTQREIAEIKQAEWEEYYEDTVAAQKAWDEEFEARWNAEDLQKIADGLYTETYYDTDAAKEFARLAREVFFEQYGDEAAATWAAYEMDDLIAGVFHGDIYTEKDKEFVELYIAAARAQLQILWGADFPANWSSYKMVDVVAAFRAGEFATSDLSADAIQIFKDAARAGLEEEWGDDFDANWEYYLADDIVAGKFHNDYTERFREIYDANIKYDGDGNVVYDEDYPELQGCVAVDKELADILQRLMDKFTFTGVENSWTKLCFYYVYLGPAAE